MARIRTIKPEFWTDEKIVNLPFECRLLFIGMWNFCDDQGYMMDEPDRIRLQVLPADNNIDFSACLDLLCASGLVDRVVLNDGAYALHIPSFLSHQKISNASDSHIAKEVSRKVAIPMEERRALAIKYKATKGGVSEAECFTCGAPGTIWWPNNSKGRPGYWVAFGDLEISHFVSEQKGGLPTNENLVLCCRQCNRSMSQKDPVSFVVEKALESSVNTLDSSRGIGLEGKGKEGNVKGKEEEGKEDAGASEADASLPSVSIKEFLLAWNTTMNQRCESTEKRKLAFRSRIRSPVWADCWRTALAKIPSSPFCMGDNDRGWVADIDWFLRPDTVQKILEGKYDKKERKVEIEF